MGFHGLWRTIELSYAVASKSSTYVFWRNISGEALDLGLGATRRRQGPLAWEGRLEGGHHMLRSAKRLLVHCRVPRFCEIVWNLSLELR